MSSLETKTEQTYGESFKAIVKSMGPAFCASIVGSYVGGELGDYISQRTDGLNLLELNAFPYLGGFLAGYGTFYAQEFVVHREKYSALNSEKFRRFCLDFFCYDFFADMAFYTPEFSATNTILHQQYDLPLSVSGPIGVAVGGLTYMAASAKFWPATQKISKSATDYIATHVSSGVTCLPQSVQNLLWVGGNSLGQLRDAYVDLIAKPLEFGLDYIGKRFMPNYQQKLAQSDLL
jgi:hypothetical protein